MTLPHPAAVLPHRGPAVLLETIVGADADALTATARVPSDSAYAAGGWTGAALIEAAAQAAAAHGACRSAGAVGAGGPVVGMLVGIKHVRIAAQVPLDAPLCVTVRPAGGSGPLALYVAEVRHGDTLLMSGELSVWNEVAPA